MRNDDTLMAMDNPCTLSVHMCSTMIIMMLSILFFYIIPFIDHCNYTLIDDLVIVLSRFLFFLIISQDSFVIPSIHESCVKKQILSS
jgi:hypothetical protein